MLLKWLDYNRTIYWLRLYCRGTVLNSNNGLVNTGIADVSPRILIRTANSNDMLIWCVTSEEGRNQLNHERTGKQRRALTFRCGEVFGQEMASLTAQIFTYLKNLLKLNHIANCLTQLIVNLFVMIPQANGA